MEDYKNQSVSAFAFFVAKDIEGIIGRETNNLKETNQYLEAKLLSFLAKIDKFEIGNSYKGYVKDAYMSHFNINCNREGKI